jgi:hypothetical protein
MARFLFFVFLIANLAFAGHIYLSHTKPSAAAPTEVNREAMKVISITDPVKAQKEAGDAKRLVESLAGAKCMQLSVKPTDAARAQTAFAAMNLGERLTSKNIEDFSRFAISLPIQRDRKSADTLVANLKKANVKDVLIMADNSISLGLFSSEEAAKRVVAELETKAANQVKGITITAKNPITRETTFAIQEPDAPMIARVAVMQRDFEGSILKGIECPVAPATATAAVVGQVSDTAKKIAQKQTPILTS